MNVVMSCVNARHCKLIYSLEFNSNLPQEQRAWKHGKMSGGISFTFLIETGKEH